MSKGKWSASLIGTNLSNCGASVYTNSAQFLKEQVPLRPRVLMVKLAADF